MPGFPVQISDARWHPTLGPVHVQAPGGEVDVVPSQRQAPWCTGGF
jgi:hypothetical protein